MFDNLQTISSPKTWGTKDISQHDFLIAPFDGVTTCDYRFDVGTFRCVVESIN